MNFAFNSIWRWLPYVLDSAGNFLCLAEGLSSNAYRNVIDIDTVGTFTTSKTVYEAFFKVFQILNIHMFAHVLSLKR